MLSVLEVTQRVPPTCITKTYHSVEGGQAHGQSGNVVQGGQLDQRHHRRRQVLKTGHGPHFTDQTKVAGVARVVVVVVVAAVVVVVAVVAAVVVVVVAGVVTSVKGGGGGVGVVVRLCRIVVAAAPIPQVVVGEFHTPRKRLNLISQQVYK